MDPHMNNGFFFLIATKYPIFIGKYEKDFQKKPEIAEMWHVDVVLT